MTRRRAFGSAPRSQLQKDLWSKNRIKNHQESNKENVPTHPTPTNSTQINNQVNRPVPTQNQVWKKLYQNTRRSYLRVKDKYHGMKEEIKLMKQAHLAASREQQLEIANLKAKTVTQAAQNEALTDTLKATVNDKNEAKSKVQALTKRSTRFKSALRRTEGRAKQKLLKEGGKLATGSRGAYNAVARDLARRLHLAGCAPSKIGSLIKHVGLAFGVPVARNMSRRTVQRCMLETLAASEMQLGYEMSVGQSITISQDSTSNRNTNYQAHHIALRAPDYREGQTLPEQASTPSVRLLRIASTLDHTSQNSVDTWFNLLDSVIDTFNNSPLSERSNTSFSLGQFALKLKAMNTDHASGEQASFDLMKTWKQKETVKTIGEQEILKTNLIELKAFLNDRKASLIDGLGGPGVWNGLDDLTQSKHEARLMEELKEEIGNKAYSALPVNAREALNLFVWAGCCMHKDQNSFKGGADAMGKFWETSGLPQPILLANKSNAAKVREVLNPSRKNAPLTEEEAAAIAATTRGGVKTAALAGALFNNKDDKKGYGDSHLVHLMSEFGLKNTHRFPDTSNTRFNSHAEAAAELLKRLSFYIQFLEDVKLRKQKPGWTNIESNVFNALQDPSTLTELAAMTLYAQALGHPYISFVRGTDGKLVNALDLGPFHAEVRNHCEKIIQNPDLLLSDDAHFSTATLDGKPWNDIEAVAVVKQLREAGKLPNLQPALVAFFKGALTTWVRFSSEFAPGGTIDTMTIEERDLAWVPATNDTNEGALGAYRVHMRNRPNTTLHNYNAQAVCQKNGTLDFMDTMFTEEDRAYVRKVARKWDSSGLERKRKEAQAAFEKKLAEMKREKAAEGERKARERRERLAAVKFVPVEEVHRLTVKVLDEHLNALRECYGDDTIPIPAHRGLKPNKVHLLEEALKRHIEKGNQDIPHSKQDSESILVDSWTQGHDELENEMMEDDEVLF
ncbi:hypothetical protein MD484_g4288, partial [Candolleomyces efflorescens]